MVFWSPTRIATCAFLPGDKLNVAKPKIDELLVQSALQPDLCRRLQDSPDEVFQDFDLTVEERELLRQPDHRLLPLLGAAIERRMHSSAGVTDRNPVDDASSISPLEEAAGVPDVPPARVAARALPDSLMGLTVVPCALRENGQFKGISYVLWVNPLAEGVDPATLPPPAGTVLPGEPLPPLHAIIRISAVQSTDVAGNTQLAIWGSFLPTPGAILPPPPDSSGDPDASPFKSSLNSAEVQTAIAAVRAASTSERYDRLADLLHTLNGGGVR
jgi:hypothetical protein